MKVGAGPFPGTDFDEDEHIVSLGSFGRITFSETTAKLCCPDGVNRMRRQELTDGPLAAMQHYLEGKLAIHASCVGFGRFGVAVMGVSGTGKSTTSAGLVSRGLRLISDGMTIVDPQDGRLWDGPKRYKLSDESIMALGADGAGEYVNEQCQKRYVYCGEQVSRTVSALRIAYQVQDGDREAIETLSPRDQLMGLVANGYLGSQIPAVEHPRMLARSAALLSSGLVVRQLVRRKTWEAFGRTVDVIMRDLEDLLAQ